MDNTNLVITLILIFVLGVVLAYFIIDYMNYKKTSGQNLTTEQTDRQTSLQSVVDQVNSTNSNIYTNINNVNTNQTNLLSGLNNLFNLSSNIPLSSSNTGPVSLLNFPGTGNVNMNLYQHVNATAGMTATGLTSTNNVQLCSASGRCTQLPNSNGDLYFTPMASTSRSSIIMDAPMTTVTGILSVAGTQLGNNPTSSGFLLQSNSNIVIQSGSSNGMAVTPTGVQIIGANNASIATITPTGSNVVINTSNMILNGNLNVQGTITSSNPIIAPSH
jgi:hypothetical protein